MQRILVTGGAGFVGSWLCKKLLDGGNKVICVDNLFTGRKSNIEPFLENEKFEFINHDITIPFDAEADQIYHLACPASPVHYQYDPIHTWKTCTLGTMHVLGIAKKVHARVLFASTSEVYGEPQVHPQLETYRGNVNTMGPRSCYDEGKRAAETLFYEYHHIHRVPVKVIRIFNTYGPNMNPRDGRVVSNFIVQALKNEDITVYGDGSQTRSFCYVEDLVQGMVRMMDSKPAFIGPVNLGNPGEFTVRQLADMVVALTGSKSKIVYRNLPVDDPTQRKPDISLAKKELGWEPTVCLQDGLQHTISYFQKVLEKGYQ